VEVIRDNVVEMLAEIGEIFDLTVAGKITDPNPIKEFVITHVYRNSALKFANMTLSTFTHALTASELADVIMDSFAKAGIAI
jgi:hypothetical protein